MPQTLTKRGQSLTGLWLRDWSQPEVIRVRWGGALLREPHRRRRRAMGGTDLFPDEPEQLSGALRSGALTPYR